MNHALITPWPLSQPLRTWCGRDPDDLRGQHLATKPEAVTCPRCKSAMRDAFATLSTWVPRLSDMTSEEGT